ncbi:MAG: hypothetical protein LBF92_06755 [Synergistaceae bacterium]|jgi:phosphoglycerate-specific signal transduction histidine kinase|nr:hypothetical protein [Synergistaceae bacterium]
MEDDFYASAGTGVKLRDPVTEEEEIKITRDASNRHESLVARLDKMEQEFAARIDTAVSNADPIQAEDRQEKLESLSTTLDSLIADLLEVEINEYSYPDFIHPDESGFPSKDLSSYGKRTRTAEAQKKRSWGELLLVVALITAIFLVGLSFGLWGAYFLGI